jgi:2-polyprenyl-6-methoxyphenol hydroxylase-like FAD-dependent oxidoreductase
LTYVSVAIPVAGFRSFSQHPEKSFQDAIARVPYVHSLLAHGRREGKLIGSSSAPNFFRTPCGLGWALVGDAGYHKDSLTGQGMSDAFRDARSLSRALVAHLGSSVPFAESLHRYHLERDEASIEMYDATLELGRLASPSAQTIRALQLLGRGEPCDQSC